MQTALKQRTKKAIDTLPEDKLKVVLDFIGYIQSKEKIPNALTRATFKKTDEGKELTTCKNAEDLFRKLGI